MIQIQNLTKQFGQRFAVKDLSFSVRKGEVLGFLGPNGAGKTTTMKMITGCIAPSSGNISIDGQDIFDHSVSVRSRIGYLPEIPPLYLDMYVEDYLKYVAQIKRCPSEKISSMVLSAMKKSGLMGVRSRLIYNLSKGFKQRVGLAQALVAEPDVLILDEPTVGLDPIQMVEIRELINDFKKDHTVILSTHILSEVESSCERVIIINKGEIVTQASIEDLKRKTGNRTLHVRVQNPSTELEKNIKSINGVVNVRSMPQGVYLISVGKDIDSEVARVAVPAGLLEMKPESIKLEDVFIQMVK